jgi:hypothetical protein
MLHVTVQAKPYFRRLATIASQASYATSSEETNETSLIGSSVLGEMLVTLPPS